MPTTPYISIRAIFILQCAGCGFYQKITNSHDANLIAAKHQAEGATHVVTISQQVTTQADVTASRTLGNTYQNVSANPLFVSVFSYTNVLGTVTAWVGSISPPATTVALFNTTAGPIGTTVFFIVLPNYYYKVDWNVGTKTLGSWIEWS